MQKKDVDITLSLLVIFMLFFGLVMISSVSVYASFDLTNRMVLAGKLAEPSNSYFWTRTASFVMMGLLMLVIFSKIPYYLFEKYSKYIFFGGVAGLILVLVIGKEINGATGWIDIPGLPSIQPVEFAKIGLIIMLAYFLKKRRAYISHLTYGFFPFFFWASLIILPLMLQPDFGSILILAPVILAMYFVGGGNIRYIGIGFAALIIGAVSVYALGKTQMNAVQNLTISDTEPKNPLVKVGYIAQRVDNFFRDDKDIAKSADTRQLNDYQLKQGFIAMGSGGWTGLGFGKSIQKFGYLPESYGDFIFSIIVEELGFFGGSIIIFFYLLFAYRGYYIARSVNDLFGKYLAFGITTWIVVQAFVNIGVNLNVVPLTGVTLPFISYGGSSLVSLTIASGILLSISRYVEYKPKSLSDALQSGRRAIL